MPILSPTPEAAVAAKRVLLVEQEEAGAGSLEPLLGALGYVVAGTAPCGEEAIRSAERLSPDLVLMDVGVQGPMDPLAAALSIHERLDLPVVFLAGPGDEDALARAAGAEPFGCILKPFSERDVRISLELALARHESERRVRFSRESLADAQRIAHLGNWDWDVRTGALHWSDEIYRIFGLEPQSFGATYQAFLERVHPEDRETVKTAVETALRGSPYSIEHRIVLPGGGERHVHERGEVTFDADGRPARMQGTVQDITERKAADQAMARLQESLRRSATMSAMGALVAGVAHEVRNPLFGISATLDALEAHLETGGAPGELPQFLAVLRQELSRMTELMQDLLDYGKPAALVPLVSPLAPTLAKAAADCARLARRHQVELRLSVPEDLPRVWLDRGRLVQAIRNLLENAIQHSPQGGEVVVEAALAQGTAPGQDAGVEISVRDSGAGFAPGELQHVFEPFFSRRKGGTGLGLSIVQRVVEEHGGRVAASNHSGGGARVSVWLPLGDGPATAP